MKISYATNNLRSIEQMPPVELRPITVLVGANNSGKSTFLRSFQLLRQSIETKTSQPILWFGNYVDFGNFTTSVHKRDTEKEIEFSFNIQNVEFENHSNFNDYSYNLYELLNPIESNKKILKHKINSLSINFFLKSKDENSELSKLELCIEDYSLFFQIIFNPDETIGYYLNGNEIISSITKSFSKNSTNIFSPITTKQELWNMPGIGDIFSSKIKNLFDKEIDEYTENINVNSNPTTNNKIYDSPLHRFDHSFKNIDLSFELLSISRNILNTFPFQKEKLEAILDNCESQTIKKFKMMLKKGDYQDLQNEIEEVCSMYLLYTLIENIAPELIRFFQSTSSVGPSRAGMGRYNRMMGLDVSEVTLDSLNFPMYLMSLHENSKLIDLSNWLEEILGFRIEVEKHVGNISINIIQHGFSVNIVDSGYGFSEILPVLTQIWANSIQQEDTEQTSEFFTFQYNNKPITIEQPELHLHPIHQEQIADALVSAINSQNSEKPQPLFIVETHSDILINRLGALIRKKQLNHNDVQIVLFSKRKDDPIATEIRTSEFTDKGTLTNWPYGFMSY